MAKSYTRFCKGHRKKKNRRNRKSKRKQKGGFIPIVNILKGAIGGLLGGL